MGESERDMVERYEVVRDRQGGSFGTDRQYTIEEWREQALDWAMADDWDEKNLEFIRNMPADKVIEYVSEMWDLDIERVNRVA